MRFLLLAFCALALPLPASAQSLYGPGGLFLHPTASLPEPGKLTPAILVLPQHDRASNDTRTWISGSLDYGLSRNLEIGATVVKVSAWDRNPSAGGYFKYRLLEETPNRPAAAFGLTQLGGGDVNTRVGFFALRKELGGERFPVTAHLGVLYSDEVDGIDHHRWEPYAGVEVGLAPKWTLALEGRARTEAYNGTPLAVTAIYHPSRDWKLALTWANSGRSNNPYFGFGAGISLGSRR